MSKKAVDETQDTGLTEWDRRELVKARLTLSAAMLVPDVYSAASSKNASGAAIIDTLQICPSISEGRLTSARIDVIKEERKKKRSSTCFYPGLSSLVCTLIKRESGGSCSFCGAPKSTASTRLNWHNCRV